MYLHENLNDFKDTILFVADKKNISPSIVEKDYYVTVFLRELCERVPEIIFKGGTSLSKCYCCINRFSEDIDITLDPDAETQGSKRNLKSEIIETCNKLGLNLLNEKNIKSRMDYNKYEIKYPVLFEGSGIKPYLLVETVFSVKSYPDEMREVNSIIGECWIDSNFEKLIGAYNLNTFSVRVQTLERTFVDKVFALCDYAISNDTKGYSRHIYDLYKLYEYIKFDEKFKDFVRTVRNDRKSSNRCYSAQDGQSIHDILKRIIDEKIYYSDYIEITEKVLFEKISYGEAISVLYKIIQSGAF